MTGHDDLDLMVEALDLLGRLNYPQLVTITALMHAMLPPRAGRPWQAARIQQHIERVRKLDDLAAGRLATLLNALGGGR